MKPLTVKLIIALPLLSAVAPLQAECPPSLIGSPCGFGGIATASQIEPGITLAAGNPVHIVTGNKYQLDIDLPPNPTAPGLELVRHYNAMDVRASTLGQGWALSYDTRLHRVNDGWQIVQADGGRISFADTSDSADGTHHSRHGRLDHIDNHHNWFWPSGDILRFDHNGRLIAIRWPSGESVYIDRHSDEGPLNGAIRSVHNDRAQALSFHYTVADRQARLTAVDTPVGRFSYDYDAPHDGTDAPHRLIRVERPDAMQRHYMHEAALQHGHPYALTGIAISAATSPLQRTHTWAYDSQGRVIRSTHNHADRTHVLHFDYRHAPAGQHAGLTVVTDAQEQPTYFHTAVRGGRYVLTSVEGAGCPGCAAPGTRADYDDNGRLIAVNGTRVQRTRTGAIHTLFPARSGWPDLSMRYNPSGLRDQWHSAVTGTEQVSYDPVGLPVERRFANGDTAFIKYDIQQRPVMIRDTHAGKQATTRLHWHGHRLSRIEHPAETETRRHDDAGRVIEREIMRKAHPASSGPGHTLHITERFSYDDQHRMIRHQLPEGGSLHYQWGQGPQLEAIYWQDIKGRRHTIIDTQTGEPGYHYGNGLRLDTAAGPDHLIRQLRLRNQDHLIWAQEISYDSRQRIAAETFYSDTSGRTDPVAAWRYAYDDHSRLAGYRNRVADNSTINTVDTDHAHAPSTAADTPITGNTPADTVTAPAAAHTSWLAWHADGSLAASRTPAGTRRPIVRRDASGLVLHTDGHDVSYDAHRRLDTVTRGGTLIARYKHNAYGYRIRRHGAQGQRSDYFYLDNRLVAQADQDPPEAMDATAQARITRRYVYAHHTPVAIIDYPSHQPEGQPYFIHADMQGAPRLMTDQAQQIRWLADYSPLGKARQQAGDMQLALRLPGHVEDPDTGWHDNLLRTYLPDQGHYLEPDPLGPAPGNQAYGYASQQPRRYADPMGLLLFAFDGTRHNADTRSNVWKMSQYYLDGPVHYHPGPGNSIFIDWDTLAAHQASRIIETQWKWLLFELSRPRAATDVTPIDILGFSRGAALARHFGNMVSQHVQHGLFQFNDPLFGAISACVDLRFMGLFDTVAQFGVAGTQNRNYDLSIAAAWEWVAHAVALHERRWLFPLTAAGRDHDHNIVEAPFIGAHADIGGGILPANRGQPGGRGDLSDVALNWMIWQARAASVPMNVPSDETTTITQPILHDFRPGASRTVQDGDRRVDAPGGQTWLNYQDDHPRLGRAVREQTERLITRHENWRSQGGVEVGIVDMDGYAQWLYDELGWHALPV